MVHRAAWVAFLSSGAVALAQLVFALPDTASRLGIWNYLGYLFPATVGAFLPFCWLATALVLALWWARRLAFEEYRRNIWLFVGLLAVSTVPYAWYVAEFTFSGPRVRDLAARPGLMGVALVSLVAAITSSLLLLMGRLARSSSSPWGLVTGPLGMTGCFFLNFSVLPNEYEPLHQLLTFGAIAFALLFSVELEKHIRWRSRGLSRALIPVGLSLATMVASFLIVERFHAISWHTQGENVGSRYLPAPFSSAEESLPAATNVAGKHVLGDTRRERAEREMRRRNPAPHLIVFSIDNIQADRVGAYGYRKNPSTTNIDRLAREGIVFEHAYTLYPGTRVFMTSMLTGRRMPPFKQHRMPVEFQEESLPVMLKRRDYHTLVKGVFELTSSRRFDPNDYEIDTNLRRATPEEIRESGTIPHIPIEERFAQIEEHLSEAKRLKRPVFIWLHMLQPHRFRGKFVPTKGFDFGKSLDGLYDSAIAGPDALIVRLERLLDEYLRDDRDTIWVIMSDHGTGMSRGNKADTGKTLYNDHVHVPLIIKGGDIPPGRLQGPIDSAVDVSATLLDLAGIEPPASYDGTSLVPLLEGRATPDALADRFIALQSGSWTGAVQGRFKLIARKKSLSLFDMEADPLEKRNIADENPDLVKSMEKRMKVEQARMSRAYFGGLEK